MRPSDALWSALLKLIDKEDSVAEPESRTQYLLILTICSFLRIMWATYRASATVQGTPCPSMLIRYDQPQEPSEMWITSSAEPQKQPALLLSAEPQGSSWIQQRSCFPHLTRLHAGCDEGVFL